MAILIHWNGDESEVHPAAGAFTMRELRLFLGCEFIEILRFSDGRLLIVDGMGRLKTPHPPVNVRATELRSATGFAIYGNALVCDPSEWPYEEIADDDDSRR